MVSRRNFMTITTMMFVLLFMFLFSGVIKENWNNYQVNEYETKDQISWDSNDVFNQEADMLLEENREYMLYIGNTEDGVFTDTVAQWCSFMRFGILQFDSLHKWETQRKGMENPTMIFLDSGSYDCTTELDAIEQYAKEGIHIVFCNLPDVSVISINSELQNLLGIQEIREESVTVDEIKLFQGFLLGGDINYREEENMAEEKQDLELVMPWYVTGSGSKTYMLGIIDDIDIDNEYMPNIIWRNSKGAGNIFAVNGNYMEDSGTGLGILSGIYKEASSYALYPVVNAQNTVFLNFPLLASENDEEMIKRYSRSQKDVLRDIIWSGSVAIREKNNVKITCMMSPQLDYEDGNEPVGEDLIYYMKLMKERRMEMGVSSSMVSNISVLDKLDRDYDFLQDNIADYSFLSFYQDFEEEKLDEVLKHPLLSNTRTVINNYDMEEAEIISYASEDVTRQTVINDGVTHTFSENLRLRSVETALGYSTAVVDIKKVTFPETEEDSWEKVYERLASNINTFWKPFQAFDKTTLAESDEKIRNYLSLDYTHYQEDDRIYLELKNFEEDACFLFRTHGEKINQIEGAEYTEVEKDTYLLKIEEETVVITLKTENELFYHD